MLHSTLRENPSAFGLYESACAAGIRLVEGANSLTLGPDFAADFTSAVGGDGGTITDAAVRRAATTSAEGLLLNRPEATSADARALSTDLFCLLYKLFFADVVVEFLRTVIAEKIKLVAPSPVPSAEDHIADWIADEVLKLLPDPCAEVEHLAKTAERADGAVEALEDPASTVQQVACDLVPETVGRALGLIVEPGSASEGTAPTAEGGSAA